MSSSRPVPFSLLNTCVAIHDQVEAMSYTKFRSAMLMDIRGRWMHSSIVVQLLFSFQNDWSIHWDSKTRLVQPILPHVDWMEPYWLTSRIVENYLSNCSICHTWHRL